MRISEIMALDPVTVPDGSVLGEAARLMDEHRIRHLPVVRDGALVGVISDRDLLEPAGKLVPRLDREGELEPLLVRDVMCEQPVTLTPEASVAEAAGALVEWGIGCLPITRREALVGLVTETDLLQALVGSGRYGRLGGEDSPIRDHMTSDPATARAETTVAEATRRMSEGDFRHLPVTDAGGRLTGIVSDRDLRRAAGAGAVPSACVQDLAVRQPSTASADEPVSLAALRMSRDRIGALPIVDRERRLVGILTTTDVLRHIARVLA